MKRKNGGAVSAAAGAAALAAGGAESEAEKGACGVSSALQDAFNVYALHLDTVNEKRERLVKASRDITMSSKKVIFATHRATSEAGLEAAFRDLETVRLNHIGRIAQELSGTDYFRFLGSFCWGLQEYVEASTFLHFCQHGSLQTLDALNATLTPLLDADACPFRVGDHDYLMGLADLTGEVMRLSFSGSFQPHTSPDCCRRFVQSLYTSFCALPKSQDLGREMGKKLEVMHSSLLKIEQVAYNMHVRGSEYPQDMLLKRLQTEPAEDLQD